MSLYIRVLVILMVGYMNTTTAQIWVSKKNIPYGTSNAKGFVIGDKIYLLVNRNFWEYDPNDDTWTYRAFLPSTSEGIVYPNTFSAHGKGYVVLGADFGSGTDRFKNDVWEYDPQRDIWNKKSKFPGAARYGACGFVINDKLYVGGGQSTKPYNDFYEYDPLNDLWKQRASLPIENISDAMTFSINGKGYIVSGGNVSSAVPYLSSTYEYDPTHDTWQKKTDYPGTAASNGIAFIQNNIAYCGTGHGQVNGNVTVADNVMYSYNPVLDTWNVVGNFPGERRWNAAVITIDDKVYVGGGSTKPGDTASADWWVLSHTMNIEEQKKEQLNNITLYPNPANDYIVIPREITAEASIVYIYSAEGKKIKTCKVVDDIIDISNVPNGIYLLELKTEHKQTYHRISILH